MSDPRRLLARVAQAGVLLVLLVTTSSAYLRLTSAGLGCVDWPACYGRAASPDATSEAAPPASAARVLHRVSASAAGAAVLAIALIAFVNRRGLRHEFGVALALLALTLGLALLGRATPGAQSPAVPVGNLLGGMLMAGLLGWLALGGVRSTPASVPSALDNGRRGRGGGAWLSALALVALALAIALGAMTSATYSSLACTTLPDCGGRWWPAAWSPSEFDMLLPYAQRQGPSAALHLAHRYAALAVAVMTLAVAALLWRRARSLALVLSAVLALQLALGLGAVGLGLPLAITLLHNVTAALLLLALVAAHRTLLAG